MLRIILVISMCIAISSIGGCATFKADLAKVETKVEAVDWDKVAAYWQAFDRGLIKALPVAEALFPGSIGAIETIVKPVLASANVAVLDFTTVAQAVKAGTLTSEDAEAMAKETRDSVMAASSLIGQALKGKVTIPSAIPTT